MADNRKVPKRISQTVLNSLKGGVVPRIGLPYITVGRKNEIEALLHDVAIISEGGASFRFIVGKYGSGKSFLLQTIRNYVMDRGFIVVDADLSPERRLQGTHGQGLATYRELISNLSTRTKPEGGALTLVLDRWISTVQSEAIQETGLTPDDPALAAAADKKIYAVTASVSELVHGFEFARLLSAYYHAYLDGDDETKARVVRWFRGEYTLKSEAKEALGISMIITDDDWYDYLKLFATFFRLAGYAGMFIMIDELVNIFKIPNSITRQYNYEKILTMYNDTLQGKARYLGILMGATPQALEDRRRGIYSYEALRSRLAEGRFSRPGARDLLAPVIRLEPLTSWRRCMPGSMTIRAASARMISSVLSKSSTDASGRIRTSLRARLSGISSNCLICFIRIRTSVSPIFWSRMSFLIQNRKPFPMKRKPASRSLRYECL